MAPISNEQLLSKLKVKELKELCKKLNIFNDYIFTGFTKEDWIFHILENGKNIRENLSSQIDPLSCNTTKENCLKFKKKDIIELAKKCGVTGNLNPLKKEQICNLIQEKMNELQIPPTRQTPPPTRQTPPPTRQTRTPTRQTRTPTRQTRTPTRQTPPPTRQTPSPTRQTPSPTRQTPSPTRQTRTPTRQTRTKKKKVRRTRIVSRKPRTTSTPQKSKGKKSIRRTRIVSRKPRTTSTLQKSTIDKLDEVHKKLLKTSTPQNSTIDKLDEVHKKLLKTLKEKVKNRLNTKKDIKLPRSEYNITKQYLESELCDPRQNKFCDDDKVCDIRPIEPENPKSKGVCLDKNYKIPSAWGEVTMFNGKKVIGSQDLINKLKQTIEDKKCNPSKKCPENEVCVMEDLNQGTCQDKSELSDNFDSFNFNGNELVGSKELIQSLKQKLEKKCVPENNIFCNENEKCMLNEDGKEGICIDKDEKHPDLVSMEFNGHEIIGNKQSIENLQKYINKLTLDDQQDDSEQLEIVQQDDENIFERKTDDIDDLLNEIETPDDDDQDEQVRKEIRKFLGLNI
jgi:hypothetical protein